MRIASQSDARERGPIRIARFRGALKSALAAATLALGAIAAAITAARAEAPRKDLWQTYMEAALGSDQSDEFIVEGITLRAAMDYAKKHDPDGQRQVLVRLPLMLVYDELGKDDLRKPLYDLGLRMNLANPDKRYDDYIETIDAFAQSYYDRWTANPNDPTSAQATRKRGAGYSYLIEVALRAELRPGDKIGLASTMSQVGAAYANEQDYECAGYEHGRAFEMFKDFRRMNGAMAWAGSQFSVAPDQQNTTHDQQDAMNDEQEGMMRQAVLDTEVHQILALGRNMTTLAYQAVRPQSGDIRDLTQCDHFGPPAKTAPPKGFDAQVSRTLEYFDAVVGLTDELHRLWSSHPIFGFLAFRLADLYVAEFEMSQVHSDQYPDALAKARAAYDDSLKILTRAGGMKATFVVTVATSYVDFLIEAKLNDEAKKVEERFGVTPSPSSN